MYLLYLSSGFLDSLLAVTVLNHHAGCVYITGLICSGRGTPLLQLEETTKDKTQHMTTLTQRHLI